MPTASQTFKAIITADSGGAVKDLRKFDGEVDKKTKGIASKFDKLGGAIAGALGGVAIGAGIKKAINSASDLEESTSAVRATFLEAGEAVLTIGENAASSMGLSQTAFNDAAIRFSGFAEKIAGPGGDVVQIIEDLTQRSADFASRFNLDVNEAIGVFMSTLAGETEPIRKFGEDISAAAVEQFALSEGLVATKAELTETIKQQARYQLLMRETEGVAGDFANTSDGLANSQRRLQADVENLAAKMGGELLPIAADLTGGLADVVSVLTEMPDAAQDAVVGIGLLGAAFLAAGGKATGLAALAAGAAAGVSATVKGIEGDLSFLTDDFAFYDPRKLYQELGRLAFGAGGDLDELMRIDEVANTEQAFAAFDKRIIQNAASLKEARTAAADYAESLGGNVDALHFANLAAAEWSATTGAATVETDESAAAAGKAAAAEKLRGEILDQVNTALNRKRELDEKAAAATEKHRQAVKDFLDEIDKNLDSIFDYEEATIDAEDAVARLREAQLDNIATQNDAEASDQDKAQSARDMRSAEISAAEAVLRAAEAHAIEQGAAEGSTEAAILQREALMLMADQYPELRDEIALYIAELDRIPAIKTTQLILTRNTTNAQLRSVGATIRADEFGNLRRFNVGGTIPGARGEAVPIIAHAGETILPTHAPMPAVSRSSGINIGTINVMSQSGEVVPRDIVQAIARYERMNGPRYQAA